MGGNENDSIGMGTIRVIPAYHYIRSISNTLTFSFKFLFKVQGLHVTATLCMIA